MNKKLVLPLLAVLIVFLTLDLALTAYALSERGFHEKNPFTRSLYGRFNLAGLLIWYIVYIIAISLMIGFIKMAIDKEPVCSYIIMVLLSAFATIELSAVVSNIIVLTI